jgi:hypothetical protein
MYKYILHGSDLDDNVNDIFSKEWITFIIGEITFKLISPIKYNQEKQTFISL